MAKYSVDSGDMEELLEGIRSNMLDANFADRDPFQNVIHVQGDNGFYKLTIVHLDEEDFVNSEED